MRDQLLIPSRIATPVLGWLINVASAYELETVEKGVLAIVHESLIPELRAAIRAGTRWIRLCKWTDDPKLQYLERWFDREGIVHRRNGHSFHAPILEVAVEDYNDAYDLLIGIWDGEEDDEGNPQRFDDVPDDADFFEMTYQGSYLSFDAESDPDDTLFQISYPIAYSTLHHRATNPDTTP